MPDATAAFAALLADLKHRSRRSYAALAHRCGDISGSTLHRYCRGLGVPPDYAVVERIARACSASPAQLAELRRRWLLADYHRRLPAPAGPAPATPPLPAEPAAPPSSPPPAPQPARPDLPRPRQLPPATPHFTGRAAELAALTAVAADLDEPGGTVVISAIGGTAGVGKTALALHWAHRVADRFPAGQLYVDLRGFDPSGQVMAPEEAVRGFLEALGVGPQQIPAGAAAQVGLYRSLLAGRRMLLVLDNARDSAQVRPLLPGTPGCLVVVTSRSQLDSLLAAEGAHPVTLDVLTSDEAHQMLAGRLSSQRVAAEPAAVADIIDRCARLPLALSIVAARAASHRTFPLTALLDELRHSGGLDALAGGDPSSDVRAVLSWSYGALTPAAARLFRLLGLHPGPELTVEVAASLAGLPLRRARLLLAELTRAHLITERAPGRFGFHDLLRAYAAEQAQVDESEPDRADAIGRMLDHYVQTAHAAVELLHRSAEPIVVDPCRPGVTTVAVPDHDAALRWLSTEYPALVLSVEYAAATGADRQCWQLAFVLATFLGRRGHWHDLVRTASVALGATTRLDDRPGRARAHRGLGLAYAWLDRVPLAHHHLRLAVELFDGVGDLTGRAYTHLNIAFVFEREKQPAAGLRHAETAADLFRSAGNRTGQAQASNTVGWHHAQLGAYDAALGHCRQALALLQELEHRNGEADTWDSLGYAHAHLGQHAEAVGCYRRALALYRSFGDRFKEASTLESLGDTHRAAGDPDRARTAWLRAMAILAELDQPAADGLRKKLTGAG